MILLVLAALPAPVRAEGEITVVKSEHQYEFKGPLTFRLAVKGQQPITAIRLFYQVSGQTSSHRVTLEFDPALEVQVEHTEDMNDPENYQPPMITFTYWWVIEDQAGNRLKTDPVSFVYEDTRYQWDVLEGDEVRLYWHDQDQAFGQELFDRAVAAAADLAAEFGVESRDPVSIVVYNSHEELMSVLQEASSEWTGAVNFGRTGSIAVGLGPMSWMEKVIPHELTHAMLDQITQPPFGEIPRWLNEGLAVHSEGGMSVEEQAELDRAIEDDTLISLRVLNSPFPDQRDRAILSYAESTSLVEFIIAEYGTEKLGELVSVFAEGAHYDDAMMEVFGVDMDGMEDLWRAYVGAQPRTGITRATPVPTAALTEQPSPELTATATPVQVAVATSTPAPATAALATATPAPASQDVPTPTPGPAPRAAVPCVGSLGAVAMAALFVAFRPRSAA